MIVAMRDYEAAYVDPIAVRRGAMVRVEREDTELSTWWWCIAADGRAGWVPAELLTPAPKPGSVGWLRADYTAQELTVKRGTTLEVLEARTGWYFVRSPEGVTGWVPASLTVSDQPPAA